MLQKMREHSQSTATKILLGLLIIVLTDVRLWRVRAC